MTPGFEPTIDQANKQTVYLRDHKVTSSGYGVFLSALTPMTMESR